MNVDESQQKIFQLWVNLSKARWRKEIVEVEMKTNPWDSNDPQVKAAWDALTHPNNLAALEYWDREPEKMNAVAHEVAAKAIACCRKRGEMKPG